MKPCALCGDDRLRVARCEPARWVEHVQLWRPRDPDLLATGDHEAAVVLLGGTFDLAAGGTAWPARGARRDPFTGRPMVVFLPPHTQFRTANGHGEILLVAARRPEQPAAPSGRAVLAHKPLLPLAGSGKAYDPTSGDWRPAESFPTAPESLPPRRFQRLPAGACTLERLLPPDYKAATLSVDEVVVPAGAVLCLADVPARPPCDEAVLFVRGAGGTVAVAGDEFAIAGDAVLIAASAELDGVVLRAGAAPLYAALAWAGKHR